MFALRLPRLVVGRVPLRLKGSASTDPNAKPNEKVKEYQEG